MKRIGLVRGAVAALLLLPGISFALGLGDVHLNSALNAPLDAEIELVNATPEDLATLDAKLASKETFARYGLDWPPFMASITVTRDRGANGSQVLRLKSNETVTEPFLTLLIEATWARGRLVREYTVLLDPPVFAPNSVTPAQVAPPVSAPQSASTGEINRPVPQQAPSAAPMAAGGGDSYEVQRGDSLSAIARRLSASTGARTDQLMVSIFRGNPSAFEGDMNRLRAGAVLRVPSGDEIAAVSPAEASAEISRVAGSWASTAGSSPSGRLRLVPPSDSASAGSGAANSAEVAELQSRVRELEGQLTESKRMLELRNTELADLQAKLAASQQAGAAQPAQPPPAAQVEAPTTTPEATPPAATPEATPETATPEAAAPSAEPAPTPGETQPSATEEPAATPAADQTDEPSFVDTLVDNWYILAGVLALVVLGVVFTKSRGKRKTAEFDDRLGRLAEQGEDRLAEPVVSISDTGRMQAPAMAAAVPDDILVEESGTHRALQETQDIPLAPTVRTDETISSETAVNLDQGDPLAEADFHMAYGLYDQAADLVRIAIQREPGRRDLKLKLLEVFFVWGNKEQFLATAQELSETRGSAEPGEWDKIVIMGKQIAPEDPMFAESGSGSAVGVDLNLEAGGTGRVDFDPFDVSARMDVTGGGGADPVDLDLGSALRDPDATGEGLALPNRDSTNQTTREMTVKMTPAGSEAPTVEQPALRPLDEPTIREKVEGAMRRKLSSDQTAELALDDLGLELGSLEQTDSSLRLKPIGGAAGPDANAPTMVAGLDENSQRLLRAAAARQAGNGNANPEDSLTEHGASGTWFLTERELGGDVDLTKGRPIDPNSTAAMAKFEMPDEGFDISSTSRLAAIDRNNLDFPVEPTREQPAMGGRKVDLDLGGGGIEVPGAVTEELAVPDLEPVTLSEVGTKLDLARAYVDMGDPDGARNILNEVLSEGSASQKQEAQRLLESLPG
jgi:pilus assembly protein FimV